MEWLNQIGIFHDIITPILDVGLLAFLLYQGYSILEETKAIQLLKGAVTIAMVYALSLLLNLDTLLWILNKLVPGIMIALAIVFQPELRRIFTRIGQREVFRFKSRSRSYHIDYVLNAIEVLSSRNRGALVVFSRNVGLKNILDTGTKLNADLSSGLIITIFGHDTPLHDGAIIIHEGKIAAAGCFLPLSKQADIRKSFGTRHRAALGLAEESDAVVLIASEETGAISMAYESNLYYGISVNEASRLLKGLLQVKEKENAEVME